MLEYGGPGVETLSVPERATITNMGAELGVTTSVFPSDEVTRAVPRGPGPRGGLDGAPAADPDAAYDRTIDIDLGAMEPWIALPHSPDNVKRVREVAGLQVDQVLIGSCTNSSYRDLMTVAAMLKGRKADPAVSLGDRARDAPGAGDDRAATAPWPTSSTRARGCWSRPAASASATASRRRAARSRCAPTTATSKAAPGTRDAQVYLVSPESAVAAALTGRITDPRDLGLDYPAVPQPERFFTEADMFVQPTGRATVYRGPAMGPLPSNTPMPTDLAAAVVIKLGDKVTTDHIIPAGSAGRYRSNIAKSSEFVFKNVDPEFPARCAAVNARGLSSVIVAGLSYGQGSSREHAAICPMFLGVRAVIAKSVERIHLANLVNFGIMPLIFQDPADLDRVQVGDELEIAGTADQFRSPAVAIINRTRGESFTVGHTLTPRQVEIVLCGGLLNFVGRQGHS